MKQFNLSFEGSVLDQDRNLLPSCSGIYLVYVGTLTQDRQQVNCREMIYIGQADDICHRLETHDRHDDFLAELQEDEVLFYSYAKVEKEDLDRVEHTLIFSKKPKLNTIGKDVYPYPATKITSEGQCALLDRDIELEGDLTPNSDM